MDPKDLLNCNSSGTGWNQYPGHSSTHSSVHERMNQSFTGSTPSVNHMSQSMLGQGMNQSFSGQSHGNEDQSVLERHGNVSNLMNQSLPINPMTPIVPMSNSSRSQWTSQTSGLNNNPPSSSFMPMASMMMNPMMAMNPMTSGPWTSTTGLNNTNSWTSTTGLNNTNSFGNSGLNPGGFGNSGLIPGGFGNSGLNPGGFGPGMNGGQDPSVGSFAANAALQNWLIQYNQWWHYVENRRREAIRMATPASERPRLTPHRYPHRHCRSSFGARNQLIVSFGTSLYIQAIDPSLIDFGESVQVTTWPGPLTYDGKRASKDDVLEYIRLREGSLNQESNDRIRSLNQESNDRVKSLNQESNDRIRSLNQESNDTVRDTETVISQSDGVSCSPHDTLSCINHEKKLIWLLLSMLLKQNGTVSGPDISELLISHYQSDFISHDQGTHLAQFRRYLMLGQKKTALEFATKNGLWGHAFVLTFFTNCIKNLTPTASAQSEQGQIVSTSTPTIKPDDPMVLMVSKFMNTTIDRDDPLSILYRSLLSQIHESSTLVSGRNPHLLPSGVNNSNNNCNKVIKTDNLQQFSILLANDCQLGNQVIPRASEQMIPRASELVKLIIALRNHSTQSLINISRLDTSTNNPTSSGYETNQGLFPDNPTNYNSNNYNSTNYNSNNYNSTNYNPTNYNLTNYNSTNHSSQEEVIRYTDELVFMNEVLEYGREEKEFIEALVPYKVKLLSRLFDFGHVTSAAAYGYQLRQYHRHYHDYFPGKDIAHSLLDWDSILSVVWDIECKLYGFDVTDGIILKPLLPLLVRSNHLSTGGGGRGHLSTGSGGGGGGGGGGQAGESVPVSEDETNGSDDLEEDETDDTSAAHVIGDKLAAMRLPTVPEDPRSRGHSDGRHRMDSDGRHKTNSDGRNRHQDTRYGQEAAYRQDLRRESSEVSDSRSASPQKAPIARTSSVSSGPYYQGNRVRTLSREDSTEQRTSSPTTPSPGHHSSIPTFPVIPQASIPPLPSSFPSSGSTFPSSGSTFFVPPPPTDEESTMDNFLSNPAQYQSQEQGHHGQGYHQPGHHQSGHGDNPSDDSDHLNRRESYGSGGGSFSQPPILESTAAPGYLESTVAPGYPGGLMGQNRETIGSPGMSAFSPINSPTMGMNEFMKPRSLSHGSTNGQMGGESNESKNQSKNQSQNKSQNKSKNETEEKKGKNPGWFGSVIAKVIPQGPVRAKLPDDSDKSIYYDDQLKRWVDKNNPDDGALMDAIAKGPPKMSMAMPPPQLPLGPGGQNPLTPVGSGIPPSAQQPLSRSTMAQSMPSLSIVGKPTNQMSTNQMSTNQFSTNQFSTNQMSTLPGSGLNGSTNEFSFVKKSNLRPKYVDAWQQQQRKND